MKKFFLCIIFLVLALSVNAKTYEQNEIDSLLRIVNNPNVKDADLIDPMARLSQIYVSREDTAIASQLINMARKLASKEKDSKYMIYVYNQEILNCLNTFPKKITLAYNIIDSIYYAIKKTSDIEAQAMGYNYIGVAKFQTNPEYDFEDFFKAFSIAEKLPKKSMKKYGIIFSFYYYTHRRYILTDPTRAKKYLLLMLQAAEKSENKNLLCSAMTSQLFFNILYSNTDKNLLAKEFAELENFISVNQQKIQPSDYGAAISTLLSANAYILDEQNEKKIDYHIKTLKLISGNSFNNQYTLLIVEFFYLNYKKKYNEVIDILHQLIKITETLYPNLLYANYQSLASIYLKTNQYKLAAETFEKALNYHLQYESAKLDEQHQLLEVKLGIEKQKQQIEQQHRNILYTVIGAFSVIFLLLGIILLLNRQKKINKLEKEKAKLMAEKAMAEKEKISERLITNVAELERKNQLLNKAKDMDSTKLLKAIRREQTYSELTNDYTKLFQDIRTNFYLILSQRAAPNKLSKTELKCCAYILLRMSNKEIANIMNVGYKTIASHKYNIKKKLHLTEEESLEDFIVNFTPTPYPI